MRNLILLLLVVSSGAWAQGSVEERLFAAIDQDKELVAEGQIKTDDKKRSMTLYPVAAKDSSTTA